MSRDYLNLLGLAFRAGKCTIGEESVIKDIQRKKAKLVLIAKDTGPQTRKKVMDKCGSYQIPYKIADDRDTISQAIGKTGRVVIAITDKGFADKLKSMLD